MFRKNPDEKQMNIFDPYHGFPKYIKEVLHKSWAEYFYRHIFSKINEEHFAVLYSENYSRPNAPVNVLVGLLFLKELNGWTDEEMIGAFYFDYRVQYALGVTDFQKERICVNTVGNFRGRLYEYTEKHDRDLLQEEVDALTKELIEVSEMDTSLARQDSFMISANCKKMGRLELIYTVNAHMVKALAGLDEALVPKSCQHYQEKGDKNNQIYRLKKEDTESKLKQLLDESIALYKAVPESLQESQAYANLARLLEEQTKETENGGLAPRENREISAKSLQNPSEPDATFRNKAGKKYTGYVVNTVEARDREKKMGMIVYHDQQQNIVSDVELGNKALAADLKGVKAIASDGSYYSTETVKKAGQRGIEINFSALNGRKVEEGSLGVNEFVIDDETRHILCCPAGFKPVSSEYNTEKGVYRAKFRKENCADCPLSAQCPVKEQKRFKAISFTEKRLQADICRSKMGTKRHKELSDFRAGTEGVPSVLRRTYRIDEIPVRGLLRSRIWVHCKIMAYNFKSFYRYLRRKGGTIASSASPLVFLRSIAASLRGVRVTLAYSY